MSKHEKHVRRERRKTDRARQTRARRHPTSDMPHRAAAALAAAAAIAAGTAAYAVPVRFDNPPHGQPGHFHWASATPNQNLLDLTLPAADQPGYYAGLTGLHHTYYDNWSEVESIDWQAYYGARIQTDSPQYYGGYAVGLNAGDAVPNPSGVCYDPFNSELFCFDYRAYVYSLGFSNIPEGVSAYLGVRLGGYTCQTYGTCQYGWIGVVRTGAELEAFAWGYETEFMTPVAAGAGGTDAEPGDMDDDGDVDMDDVPHFVAVLLGNPTPPGILPERADINDDGDSDGDDIQQFVDKLLE